MQRVLIWVRPISAVDIFRIQRCRRPKTHPGCHKGRTSGGYSSEDWRLGCKMPGSFGGRGAFTTLRVNFSGANMSQEEGAPCCIRQTRPSGLCGLLLCPRFVVKACKETSVFFGCRRSADVRVSVAKISSVCLERGGYQEDQGVEECWDPVYLFLSNPVYWPIPCCSLKSRRARIRSHSVQAPFIVESHLSVSIRILLYGRIPPMLLWLDTSCPPCTEGVR